MRITINIPDEKADRVLDGFCQRYHYVEVLDDGKKNTETKQQFLKRQVLGFIRRAVLDAEQEAAMRVVNAAIVENDITLT